MSLDIFSSILAGYSQTSCVAVLHSDVSQLLTIPVAHDSKMMSVSVSGAGVPE